MRLLGNLTLAGGGVIENARIENLVTDPLTPQVGQIWYNSTAGVYKGWDGTSVITFASGGNTQVLLDEIDAIELAAGLNSDGTFSAFVGTNYLDSSTSLKNAATLLDTRAKTNADAIASANAATAALQSELDATQTGAGLNANGTYTANVGANYISGAASLNAADVLLDTQVKSNTDGITAANAAIATKVSKAGDSMTGNLAFGGTANVTGLAAPVAAGDATNKAYVDNLVNGLSWLPPVDSVGASTPLVAASAGLRFLNTTDNKIYVSTGVDTWDLGTAGVDGQAVMDRATETGYVHSGTAWVQFTGAGQITAGVGLVKVGNTIDVNLGAGIAQLPSDEVGLDVRSTGGLFLTDDGVTASTLGSAKLAILLDGASLTTGVNGIKVAASGVTATEIAASVAGAGLTGGAGSALAVGAGSGITVGADSISLDTTVTDALYVNLSGDTMTGDLTLAADPTTALMAATKQYVDAVNTRLAAGTFLYDGTVAATSHVVTHNLNNQYAQVTVYDSANKVIIPDSITADTANQLTVTFASAITCKVVVTAVKN